MFRLACGLSLYGKGFAVVGAGGVHALGRRGAVKRSQIWATESRAGRLFSGEADGL